MNEFFKKNPAIVISLFVGYIVWIGLVWESAFLGAFGVSPVDYASIQDLFSFGFRRPDRILASISIFISFFIAPYILRFFIPDANDDGINFTILTLIIFLILVSTFSIGNSAESYAKEIQAMTPKSITNGKLDSISRDPIVRLLVADITMNRKFNSTRLSDQIIISKLNDNIICFDLETKHLLIVSQSSVERIEITYVPSWQNLNTGHVLDSDTTPEDDSNASDSDTQSTNNFQLERSVEMGGRAAS